MFVKKLMMIVLCESYDEDLYVDDDGGEGDAFDDKCESYLACALALYSLQKLDEDEGCVEKSKNK